MVAGAVRAVEGGETQLLLHGRPGGGEAAAGSIVSALFSCLTWPVTNAEKPASNFSREISPDGLPSSFANSSLICSGLSVRTFLSSLTVSLPLRFVSSHCLSPFTPRALPHSSLVTSVASLSLSLVVSRCLSNSRCLTPLSLSPFPSLFLGY